MENKDSRQNGIHRTSKYDIDDDDDNQSKSSHYADSKDIVPSKFSSPGARGRAQPSESKLRDIEDEEALEVDEEFERLKLAPTVVVPLVADTQEAKNFVNGFRMSVIISIWYYFGSLTEEFSLQNLNEYEGCKHR